MLTRVTLQDYGVYQGRNEFDLATTERRPVVLLGGKNGAGKTTLFDSIMLCLYGMSGLGRRTSKKEYHKMLHRRIHRRGASSAQPDGASVAVQFRFSHGGREAEYRVERSWARQGGGMDENLAVARREGGGEFVPLDAVDSSHWQSFIADIMPKGIMSLFFFDGEKVTKMADDGTEDATIRESFKSLLGIGTVEQLLADLRVNLARNMADGAGPLREEFDRLRAEKDESLKLTERLRQRLAQKQNEMDALDRNIESLEGRISGVGGDFARGRESARVQLAEQRAARESAERGIADLCSGALPFSLIPRHLGRLSETLDMDAAIQESSVSARRVGSELQKARGLLMSKPREFWEGEGVEHSVAPALVSVILAIVEREILIADTEREPAFGFSAGQAAHIRNVIGRAGAPALEDLSRHTAALVEANERASSLERAIANAPRDDEIGPLVSRVGRLHSEKGALRAEMDHIEAKLASHGSLRQRLDSKLRGVVDCIYKSEKSQQRVLLTRDVQGVLEEFAERMRLDKVRLLERYMLEAAGLLMHNRLLFDKVRVDPDTFEVRLFKDGEPVPEDGPSKGERQMIAMSVLWSLARASGRPLPFMIDTPLARLDTGHRDRVVERFLPAASHQILVFSTDEEIRSGYYKSLLPYISHSYVLRRAEGGGATRPRRGYFWDGGGRHIAAV